MGIHIVLPVPPSANRLHVRRSRGKYARRTEYETWRKEAGLLLNQAVAKQGGPLPAKSPLAVSICADIGRHRDLDNIIKPTLDLLQGAAIDDDRWIDIHAVQRDLRHRDGKMTVSVETVAALQAKDAKERMASPPGRKEVQHEGGGRPPS